MLLIQVECGLDGGGHPGRVGQRVPDACQRREHFGRCSEHIHDRVAEGLDREQERGARPGRGVESMALELFCFDLRDGDWIWIE